MNAGLPFGSLMNTDTSYAPNFEKVGSILVSASASVCPF